jgi:hypothetical protein
MAAPGVGLAAVLGVPAVALVVPAVALVVPAARAAMEPHVREAAQATARREWHFMA